MRGLRFLIIAFLPILFSCNNYTPHHYEKQILGEWVFVKQGKITEDRMGDALLGPGHATEKGIGYTFFANIFCESKSGPFNGVSKTSYKLSDDSLAIFDLSEKSWKHIKIAYILADTMLLKYGDTAYVKAARER